MWGLVGLVVTVGVAWTQPWWGGWGLWRTLGLFSGPSVIGVENPRWPFEMPPEAHLPEEETVYGNKVGERVRLARSGEHQTHRKLNGGSLWPYTEEKYWYAIRHDAGWPAMALWCGCRASTETATPPFFLPEGNYFGSLAIDPRTTRSIMGELAQGGTYRPYLPNWSGLVIDTMFWGGFMWLLMGMPWLIRKWVRRRRGGCSRCGYPIGVSPVCTESGARVRVAKGRE